MLSACAPSNPTSGGTSNIESSSTPTTSEKPTSEVPQMKDLTLEEAKAQAKSMIDNIKKPDYVEPNSYQLKASKSKTNGTNKSILNDVFTVNHKKEVMSLYEYDIPLSDTAKPYNGVHIFKKSGNDYYVTNHTSSSKEYIVVKDTTFDATIKAARFGDFVGYGNIKEVTISLLDSIVNADFSDIGLNTMSLNIKGDGAGRLEFFYHLSNVDEENNKHTMKQDYIFEDGKIVGTNVSSSVTNEKSETLTRQAIRYLFEYKEWNIETPKIDDSWTEKI